MSALVSALIRRSLPDLVVDEPRSDGVRSWLENGSYYVDAASTPEKIQLKNISLSEFIPYQSYDYQRFAMACVETIADCKADPTRPKAVSWPLVKMYYSCFFGGHALMRAMGRASIRIEQRQAKKLTQISRIFCGDDFVIGSGNYDLGIAQNSDRTIDLSLNKASDNGGAHAAFWRAFSALLDWLAADIVAKKDPDSNSAILKIGEIRKLITSSGLKGGNWLSSIRNEITYQHRYGVWFPFGASAEDVQFIARLKSGDSASIRLDYNAAKDPIRAFCAGNLIIATLSAEVAQQLADRAKQTLIFPRQWKRLGLLLTN